MQMLSEIFVMYFAHGFGQKVTTLYIPDSILPPSRHPSPPLTLPEDGMLEKTQYANHVWKDKNVHISKFGSWFQDFLGFVTEIVARVVAQQTHTVHIQEPA